MTPKKPQSATETLAAYDDLRDKQVVMYLSGMSTGEIAEKCDEPVATVTKRIRDAGVMRSKKDAQRLRSARRKFGRKKRAARTET